MEILSRLKGGIKGKVNAVKGHLKTDVFPPLKSAAGGVLALLKTAERVKVSRKKTNALSTHALQVFKALEKALPANRSTIPPPGVSDHFFVSTVHDIQDALEPLTRHRLIVPFSRLNRNEALLDALRQRLDDAYRSFTIPAVIRIELETVAGQRELKALKHQNAIIQQSIQDQVSHLRSLQDQAALTQKTIKTFLAISIGLF